MKGQKRQDGSVALTTVLIFMSVLTVVSVSLITVSISSLKGSSHLAEGNAVITAGDACLDEALIRLSRQGDDYDGEHNVRIEDVTCEITVLDIEGNPQKHITITASTPTSHSITISTTVDMSTTPYSLIGWEEN